MLAADYGLSGYWIASENSYSTFPLPHSDLPLRLFLSTDYLLTICPLFSTPVFCLGKTDTRHLVPADFNFIILLDVVELAGLRQGDEQFRVRIERMGQQPAVGSVEENILDDDFKAIQVG